MNKHDSFRASDTIQPIEVKYISFAGSDRSPVEFYYNCSTTKDEQKVNEIRNGVRSQKNDTSLKVDTLVMEKPMKAENIVFKGDPDPFVRKMYSDNVSSTDFLLLALCSINLSLNVIQLYCMYLFSKYLDS